MLAFQEELRGEYGCVRNAMEGLGVNGRTTFKIHGNAKILTILQVNNEVGLTNQHVMT